MSYLCISHASGNRALADRFSHELIKYGFRHACMDEHTPVDKRNTLYAECTVLLVLTSPEAAEAESCGTDLRRALGGGKPCVCVSLMPNELDERYGGSGSAAALVPYPAGETDTPDERAEALFIHRLYIRNLCRFTECFSSADCAEDNYSCAISYACKAYEGDAEAQYLLGQAYANGLGLPVLESEAAHWLEKAAASGHVDALIRMGELRLDGEGVERDPAEALRLFSQAARQGDPRGQFARGICCLYGYGLMKDPEMALRYFRAAAGAGYLPAYYRMGLLYRDGLGVEADRRMAMKCLYTAAVGTTQDPPYLFGRRLAPVIRRGRKERRRFVCVSMRFMRQKTLSRLFGEETDGVDLSADRANLKFCQRYAKARREKYPEDLWLSEAVTAKENTRRSDYSHQAWSPALAESALGRLLELGSAKEGMRPSPRAALMWYRRSAIHGHVGAVFRLGDAYRSGNGVPRDPVQSVKLFRRAAELGSRRGQFAMGVCCERGEGVAYDPAEAVRWYEMAAKRGYAPAQNNLGGCYEYGIGVAEDPLSAVEWYIKASAEGEPNATCRLGLCYENGHGVTQSYERAFRLYEDAAKHKHPYALYRLGLYYDRGVTVDPQVAYAAHLYERAAMGGVGDAAYAVALCYAEGRGVRRDHQKYIEWLKTATELGSVQGSYALGMACYEGTSTVMNKQAAVKAFTRGVELYHAMNPRAREVVDGLLPVDGMTVAEAAGQALYMLGYICLEDKGDCQRAYDHFLQAVEAGCGEAMTAIGDLYAHGLISVEGASPQGAAMEAYMAAAEKDRVEALLSLASRYEQKALLALERDDTEEAQKMREAAFRCLSRGEKQGSTYAGAGLAGCFWFGYGVKQNRNAALDHLKRANGLDPEMNLTDRRGRVMAALWLGDVYLMAPSTHATVSGEAACIKAAYEAYARAAAVPFSHLSGAPYLLEVRKQQRREAEEKARAEAQYRLAVLGMCYYSEKLKAIDIYEPLGAAVLAGHSRALDDLTRLFLYEKWRKNQEKSQGSEKKKKRLLSKKREADQPLTQERLMGDFAALYYGTAIPMPDPFSLAPLKTAGSTAELPEVLSWELTDIRRAEALNGLGDRYFYGQGVTEDATSAVSCYRRAADVAIPRGAPVSGGIVWAQYSLGYCLLHGVGTAKEPREAVRYLTLAAKHHGVACMCLAECHLGGIGVDRVDRVEALKYYRRALKFGKEEAARYIEVLEASLREEESAHVRL